MYNLQYCAYLVHRELNNNYMFASIKAKQVLIPGDIAKLVREDLCMANEVADSAVGMTKDPIINIGVLDVVRQISYKRTVDATACKLI